MGKERVRKLMQLHGIRAKGKSQTLHEPFMLKKAHYNA